MDTLEDFSLNDEPREKAVYSDNIPPQTGKNEKKRRGMFLKRNPHHKLPVTVRAILGMVFAVVAVACAGWLLPNFSLDAAVPGTVSGIEVKYDLPSKLDVFVNNSVSDALGGLSYIRKIYTIDAAATVAPSPNPQNYGTVSIDNAAQVLEVIEKARGYGLLDGQDVIFDENADFYWDSDIQYYCDETILVICWKEKIEGRVCSCIEVKIADGSQIRRKLVNDTYGSGERAYASALAKSCNAVVAMNADFYAFRDLGITVYQSQLYRYETTCDVLMIDDQGDFHFLKRGQIPSREGVEQFIKDNNIQFSIAFGPILVENGELQQLKDNYSGLGEMNMEYSRAGIGQYDKLHYLYMTVSHSKDSTPRAKVNEFAKFMYDKGVKNAYNFDGGQTGEAVFRGVPYNHVDFGSERTISDIIYFATAIPEREVIG